MRREILHFAQRALNKIDDATIGGAVAPPGTGISRYRGMLGTRFPLKGSELVFDSTVGTLYAGIYMYVRTKAGSTAAPTRGFACWWSDIDNYEVTPDGPANAGLLAGIYISAPTKGNYCVIQVGGVATVECKDSAMTKATGAVGDTAVVTLASGRVDNVADATAMSSLLSRGHVGEFVEAPVADALKKCLLYDLRPVGM